MRNIVKSGYNNSSFPEVYKRHKKTPERFEKFMCDELISRVEGKLIDLGCGVGLPFDKYFSDNGFSVTGVDISEKHIEKAKKNVAGQFYLKDFFEVKGKFDAVVSFYAIFHIPRTEHKKLLQHIHSLLKKDGHILITLGANSMKCDTAEFAGAKMAWSSYTAQKNKKLVQEAGFEILMAAEDYRRERHLWVLAKKT